MIETMEIGVYIIKCWVVEWFYMGSSHRSIRGWEKWTIFEPVEG